MADYRPGAAKSAPAASDAPVAITETAEFKAAVQEAVAKAVREAMSEVKPEALGSGMDLVRDLTKSIWEMTQQGSDTQHVRVDVREMERRASEKQRMQALLDAAIAANDTPVYQLKGQFYYGESMRDPIVVGADKIARPREIGFTKEPNDQMIPINDTAKAIFGAWKSSLGEVPKTVVGGDYHFKGGLIMMDPVTISPQARAELEAEKRAAHGLTLRNEPDQGPLAAPQHILGTVAPPAIALNAGLQEMR